MSTGDALVCKLKNLEEIEDADNLLKADMYGETIIVSKDYEEGELGLLFDCETQLSHEFCHYNNLYRHSELNKDQEQEGYFDDNRRVRPIRLRGVKCSGFWMPVKSLNNIDGINLSKDSLEEGTQITSIQGVDICKKYKKKSNNSDNKSKSSNKKGKKSLSDRIKDFHEHFKTGHFFRNTQKINSGDTVIITEKLHGTSARCGRLKVEGELSGFQKAWNLVSPEKIKPKEEYQFVVGSRRVVKSVDGKPREGVNHYYDEDIWTPASEEHFRGKLNKGETIYFEIVGYRPSGKPIMGSHRNKKLKSFMDKDEYKEFIDRYGENTVFNYECSDVECDVHEYKGAEYKVTTDPTHGHPNGIRKTKSGQEFKYKTNQYKVFVYRITRTLEGGDTIDLSWDQVKRRCQELSVNHVPELYKGISEDGKTINIGYDVENIENVVKDLTNKDSDRFPQHIREGICIRIEDGSFTPTILKNKGFLFRVMEGQIKDEDDYEDIEENN